jgi:predicted nucleotidyltransferase component of viral defense system
VIWLSGPGSKSHDDFTTASHGRGYCHATATGFRPEILEKVIHLLNLLEIFRAHLFLKNRCALKGGTALNLFLFDAPRLSVDIDLKLHRQCRPGSHAGGKAEN